MSVMLELRAVLSGEPEQVAEARRLVAGYLREVGEEDGEVTATQKVKRVAVAREFAELIASMYEDPSPAADPTASPPSPERAS